MTRLLPLLALLVLTGCTHAFKLNWSTSQSVTLEANPPNIGEMK